MSHIQSQFVCVKPSVRSWINMNCVFCFLLFKTFIVSSKKICLNINNNIKWMVSVVVERTVAGWMCEVTGHTPHTLQPNQLTQFIYYSNLLIISSTLNCEKTLVSLPVKKRTLMSVTATRGEKTCLMWGYAGPVHHEHQLIMFYYLFIM